MPWYDLVNITENNHSENEGNFGPEYMHATAN